MSRSTTHFLREQELSPQAFAEKYADPDPAKAQSPEELLRRARMILATELGKDPLLRQEMRNCFKLDALVSVSPTERGVSKIDEHHKYFVRQIAIVFTPMLIPQIVHRTSNT